MPFSHIDQPRILLIANTFPSNSETFIERKARALMASGFDVTVAAHHRGFSSEIPGAESVPFLQLPHPRDPRTWSETVKTFTARGSWHRIKPLLVECRDGHWLIPVAAGAYDLIHFEFSGIAVQARSVLPLLRPAKLSVSCRGSAERIAPFRDPSRAKALAQVFDEVDLIHCVSDDIAATIKLFGASDSKILVNRPAVHTAQWKDVGRVDGSRRGTTESPLRILSVGRLHWSKGFDDAIRAIDAVNRRGLKVEYKIAGEGPEREKLSYLRQFLDVNSSVDLLGWQDQAAVADLLGWADVFFLPSLSEGISNSALEAMAAGVPVLSTRAGGMSEAIDSSVSGTLVDVGDLEAMADALEELALPERRNEIAQEAIMKVRADFDISRQGTVFEGAYKQLLFGSPNHS